MSIPSPTERPHASVENLPSALAAGIAIAAFLLFALGKSGGATGAVVAVLILGVAAFALVRRQASLALALRTSEDRLALVLGASHDGLWDWNLSTREAFYSPRFDELLGRPAGTLPATIDGLFALIHPDDRDRIDATLRAPADTQPAFEIEFRLQTHERGYRWFVARGRRIADAAGLPVRMAGSISDVTDRKNAAAAIERQAIQQGLIARFGQLALSSSEIDDLLENVVATVNEGLDVEYCRLLVAGASDDVLMAKGSSGWDAEWSEGRVFDAVDETQDRFIIGARESFVIDDFLPETRYRRSPMLRAHDIRSAAERLICGAHGSYGVLGIYSRSPARFTDDSLHFLHGLTNTIAAAMDRKVAEERLTHMAQFDALTSLPNRSMYLDRLWQTIDDAGHDHLPIGVLFVDLDRFKAVNDTLGHGAGDAVLLQVAQRLEGCVRAGDTVGRLGGDEFAMTLAHLAKAEHAGTVAAKVRAALATPFDIEGQDVYISASIGISIFPGDGRDPDTLLKNADTAMYRAKQSGRDNHHFYLAAMNEQAVERLKLESQLRVALERREFVVFYQPKIDLATGTISGFEALLRWQHPERGLIPPGSFISILEDTSLIVPVGEWILSTVCRQIVEWQAMGLRVRPVAVNLSARQFVQKNLAHVIRDILQSNGVAPELLELELTESMLMSDSEAAVRTLTSIKSFGVRLAVDDFGTGYSSLAYLKRFPLDSLKIDRAFIRDVTTDPDDATIAAAIINLAHSLHLNVVAEGVETAEQVAFLRSHACDEVQGFFFGRPVPAADATRALEQRWPVEADRPQRRTAASAYPIAIAH